MTTQILLLAGLVLAHIIGIYLLKLEERVRRAFLSFAGGAAIAYVFLHLLPELAESHEELRELWEPYGLEEIAGYFGAAFGLIFFYGMEHLVKHTKKRADDGSPPVAAFWLHVASFALYNFVIGHLLADHPVEGAELWLYFIAMAFHFATNDIALYRDHKELYSKFGRWIVIAAIIFGWIRGQTSQLSEAMFASLFAFIAGCILMNVMKEELPEAAESKFLAFALGAIGYGALLHFI